MKKTNNQGQALNPSVLHLLRYKLLFVGVFLSMLSGCWWNGGRRTQDIIEDRVILLSEFKEVFDEDRLYREVFWYHGSKGGFAYLTWEQTTKDPPDNPVSADIHTDIRRYRIDASQVVFTPKFDFEGYIAKRKRIVPTRHADDDSAVYHIVD